MTITDFLNNSVVVCSFERNKKCFLKAANGVADLSLGAGVVQDLSPVLC